MSSNEIRIIVTPTRRFVIDVERRHGPGEGSVFTIVMQCPDAGVEVYTSLNIIMKQQEEVETG